MDDFIGRHEVRRDYYKEAMHANRIPMNCPYCKQRGRFASNAYELAKRIPSIMIEGIALCQVCKSPVVQQADLAAQLRAWYCESCEVCICPRCQKSTAAR